MVVGTLLGNAFGPLGTLVGCVGAALGGALAGGVACDLASVKTGNYDMALAAFNPII